MLDQIIGGRYRVVGKLGEGGMGAVYEARHTQTNRRVAVKLITHEGSQQPSLLARFENEAKAAGGIESQYIAQVLDAGRDETLGQPFIAMEFLSGEDFQQTLGRLGPLSVDLALRIVAQACMGLEKAHAAGIVHRDIKPANMFLCERDGSERVLKLLDFGIAKVRAEGGKNVTRTGALLGSPMYMSPEQARGNKPVDHRSDLWSLGIVLYQSLAGRTPYDHIDGIGELLMAICSEPPTPVQDLAPWVDGETAVIVATALSIDVRKRFQSASDMLKAVKAKLPNGTAIDDAMLVGVSEGRRQVVEPRADLPSAGEISSTSLDAAPAVTAPAGVASTADSETQKAPSVDKPKTTTSGDARPSAAETKSATSAKAPSTKAPSTKTSTAAAGGASSGAEPATVVRTASGEVEPVPATLAAADGTEVAAAVAVPIAITAKTLETPGAKDTSEHDDAPASEHDDEAAATQDGDEAHADEAEAKAPTSASDVVSSKGEAPTSKTAALAAAKTDAIAPVAKSKTPLFIGGGVGLVAVIAIIVIVVVRTQAAQHAAAEARREHEAAREAVAAKHEAAHEAREAHEAAHETREHEREREHEHEGSREPGKPAEHERGGSHGENVFDTPVTGIDRSHDNEGNSARGNPHAAATHTAASSKPAPTAAPTASAKPKPTATTSKDGGT